MSTHHNSNHYNRKGPYSNNRHYTGNSKTGNNKFCKVCYDAGKDESVYSSHFVKIDSIVVCPTLKATECRYCRKMGHTIKFCKVLNEKNNYMMRQTPTHLSKPTTYYNQKKMEPSTSIVKAQNIFESLDNDSDDEKEITSRWTVPVVTPREPQLKGWSNIVAASLEKDSSTSTSTSSTLSSFTTLTPFSKTKEGSVIHTNNKELAANANTSASVIASIIRPTQIKNWADYTDSEDEDDYKDEYGYVLGKRFVTYIDTTSGEDEDDYNDEYDYDNEEGEK
jgi:hypothetical protein